MKLLSSRYVTSQEGNHQETIFYQLVLVLNCGYINLSLSPPRFTWGRGQGGRPAICRSEPDPKKSSEYQLIGSVSCSSYHLIFFKMSLITDSVNMKLRFCVVSMCWQRHWNQKCYLNICAGVFAYIKVFFYRLPHCHQVIQVSFDKLILGNQLDSHGLCLNTGNPVDVAKVKRGFPS